MLFFSKASIAQTTLSGTVKDAAGNIEFATVIIYAANDSTKIITAHATDSVGKFVIDNLLFGNYVLNIQMIGYESYKTNIELSAYNSNSDVGVIVLSPDNKFTNSLTIISKKNLIKKTAQGFIINDDKKVYHTNAIVYALFKI